MTTSFPTPPTSERDPGRDPERDLLLERLVDVPVALVWKAWTSPEQMKVDSWSHR